MMRLINLFTQYISSNARQLFLLLCIASTPGIAQTDTEARDNNNHERIYQVELIVFGRADSNPKELWPNDIKLSYPDNTITLKSEGNAADGFVLLPANERLLNPQAAVLAKSGSYTLLYHQAWRQMIRARKDNIVITGGKIFDGHQELEGSIALSVGQFLKIQTNLWLTQFSPVSAVTTGTNTAESWPDLPAVPGTTVANESDKAQNYVVKRTVKINQQRTMRSGEVHYIDHPLMGIIVKIIPYETAH